MKTLETKNKTGTELRVKAAAGMRDLAEKLKNDDVFDDAQQAGIQTLNDAILALPRVGQILMYKKLLGEVGNGWFSEPLSEQQLKEKWDGESTIIDHILGNMRLHLGTYSPKLQQDILIFLLNEMPEKLREQQEQETLDDAVQGLLEAIGELPDDEQVGVYKDLTEQIKSRELAASIA